MQHILNQVLGDVIKDDLLEAMAVKSGMNVAQTRSTMQEVVPAIFGGLAKNTKKKDGLSALFGALQKDHDGSALDQAKDVIANPEQFKASKILGHILGSKEQPLAQMIGKNVGADTGAVDGLMKMAAPLVMGQLGKSLQKYGLNARQLQELLKVAGSDGKKMNKSNALLVAFLDQDGDGDVKDDLLGMGKRWLSQKLRNRG